jgi:hypothetical protein
MSSSGPNSAPQRAWWQVSWETAREFAVGTRQKSHELLAGEVKHPVPKGEVVDPMGEKSTGVAGTLNRICAESSKEVQGTGLYQKQVSRAQELLRQATAHTHFIRKPIQPLRAALLLAVLGFLVVFPWVLLSRYGWNDQDLRQASNLAQALEAIASGVFLLTTGIIGIILLELRIRTREASNAIQECRVLIQVIDSHALSKDEVNRRLRGCADAAELELSVEQTVEYLLLAGSLARVVAKIAALYAQSLPRESLVREADALFQLSMEVERSCLLKISLLKYGIDGCQ